jgi:hypothetical protein
VSIDTKIEVVRGGVVEIDAGSLVEGDANGAPHPDPAAYAKRFSGKYAHRLLTGGIGHNLRFTWQFGYGDR